MSTDRVARDVPGFLAIQRLLAAHVRDPEGQPAPAGLDPRRVQVHVELVFGNVDALLRAAFPIARSILGDAAWRRMVRRFLRLHPASSPYFPDLSQELLEFLATHPDPDHPPFLLELCHFEWMEFALAVAEDDAEACTSDEGRAAVTREGGDLMSEFLMCTGSSRLLSYTFPVHRIGIDFQPVSPENTYLVAWRQPDDRVRFHEVTAPTLRLLQLLDGSRTGAAAIRSLQCELQPAEALEAGIDADRDALLVRQGKAILERLWQLGVIHPRGAGAASVDARE